MPAGARPDVLAALRADLEAPRHPADGGGRAWIANGTEEAVAGRPGRWEIRFETGPLGIAEGGWVFLQVPPFWGWSTPQVTEPMGPGFTAVRTGAEGVELEPATLDHGLLGVAVRGRGLEPGEELHFVYGAGPAGALADRFAEEGSRFWIAVDGDGDGVRKLIEESPAVTVRPGPAARLALHVPATARPGEAVPLTVALLDALGSAGVSFAASVEIGLAAGPPLELPAPALLAEGDGARARMIVHPLEEGVYRFTARTGSGLVAESNPLAVSWEAPRVLWGDLHGHSNLSDGTGTPEQYFRYARDVAALDVVALTDHDHWGMEPLALHPERFEQIRAKTAGFHEPGRFVTLLGYEWTSWVHGHRHVLYFEDRGKVLSSVDPRYESPIELWEALRGQPALTFAHHSAGGPVPTNWEIPPDPELEPVTEIVSVHGSSEAPDSPAVIYAARAGNFVRDVLGRGYRLGFIGSGDGHDGHPGLSHLASASGGMAAILSEELTREGVLEALRARRVYATNGPRILLRATLEGRSMGSAIAARELPRRPALEVEVVATAPLDRLELIGGRGVILAVAGEGARELRLVLRPRGLRRGDALYVRALQDDGGAAWSSPFFID